MYDEITTTIPQHLFLVEGTQIKKLSLIETKIQYGIKVAYYRDYTTNIEDLGIPVVDMNNKQFLAERQLFTHRKEAKDFLLAKIDKEIKDLGFLRYEIENSND